MRYSILTDGAIGFPPRIIFGSLYIESSKILCRSKPLIRFRVTQKTIKGGETKCLTYLSNKGYSKDNIFPTIISYGTASSITHFSKVVDSTVTRAKWGHLERLTSGSWDPYYTSSYGHPVSKYRK
ncbi:MAG: DUF7689 domain-containing protein [Bacillota bacterium]